eukprot:365602-Chlamydomonas_euryale.AAC.11
MHHSRCMRMEKHVDLRRSSGCLGGALRKFTMLAGRACQGHPTAFSPVATGSRTFWLGRST